LNNKKIEITPLNLMKIVFLVYNKQSFF